MDMFRGGWALMLTGETLLGLLALIGSKPKTRKSKRAMGPLVYIKRRYRARTLEDLGEIVACRAHPIDIFFSQGAGKQLWADRL